MFVHLQSAERLGKVLSAASAAMGAKSDANSLAGAMLLETGTNDLNITVVDTSSHQLRLTMPAQVSLPGSILIPGDYLPKIMMRLGDHAVQLRAQNNVLTATAGDDTHRFDLFQGEAADFPLDMQLPPVVGIVDGDGLHEALKAVMQGATDNEQDILFHGQDMTMGVYTSMYITCRSRFQMQVLNQDFSFGIPKSVLMGGRLPQWSGAVNIHIGDGKVVFSKDQEHLLIRRIQTDTKIPELNRVLDSQAIGKLVVPLQTLRSRAHTISIGKQNCVVKVIDLNKPEKKLVVAAENAGIGASTMKVPVSGHITGTVSEVKLDVSLLEKALKTVDGDDVIVDFVDYVGDGEFISLRFANESNPEKRQTMVSPLQ